MTRGKLSLDTNIFIYTLDNSVAKKRAKAIEIIAQAVHNGMAAISYQVVQEFLNVATRKFPGPLSTVEVRSYLEVVLWPLCEVHPSSSLYSRTLSISAATQISFNDALIVCSAQEAGCEILLTEDLQHGRRIGDVEIRNPFV